jgi:hypothetical protein
MQRLGLEWICSRAHPFFSSTRGPWRHRLDAWTLTKAKKLGHRHAWHGRPSTREFAYFLGQPWLRPRGPKDSDGAAQQRRCPVKYTPPPPRAKLFCFRPISTHPTAFVLAVKAAKNNNKTKTSASFFRRKNKNTRRLRMKTLDKACVKK